MIIDTTVMSKALKSKINELVGKPFSVLKIMKIGAIGSHRMIVDNYSLEFNDFLTRSSDLNYCNMELRPKGVIVHLSKDRTRFSWIIPYYRLSIFESKQFSIHAEGQYLRINRDKRWKMNTKFLAKMLILKQKAIVDHMHLNQ